VLAGVVVVVAEATVVVGVDGVVGVVVGGVAVSLELSAVRCTGPAEDPSERVALAVLEGVVLEGVVSVGAVLPWLPEHWFAVDGGGTRLSVALVTDPG